MIETRTESLVDKRRVILSNYTAQQGICLGKLHTVVVFKIFFPFSERHRQKTEIREILFV